MAQSLESEGVRTREPRKYVDFSSVPPSQWKMHDRLSNWARWSDSRTAQKTAPGFDLYRSSDARRAYGEETVIPVDKDDAQRIHKGISAPDFPDKQRRALQWLYLRPIRPAEKAAELGVSLQGLADLAGQGRQILINRKI